MKSKAPAPVHRWVVERPPAEVERAIQRIAWAEDVVQVSIMPDVHLAHDVCVGTVVATTRLIYPAAVGGDIGCGILAAAFDGCAAAISKETAREILDGLRRAVPANRHGRERTAPAMPNAIATADLSHRSLDTIRRRDGSVQFATLGRGNHFLELQADEDDRLWIMIHSGSRAMGPAIRDLHLANADGAGLIAINADDSSGQAYLNDAGFARRYAAANRRAMLDATTDLVRHALGFTLDESTIFDCDHNHVVAEQIGQRTLYIHRKGANSAREGERGSIPGSMATESYHSLGRGEPESLYSSSHGAGRSRSRAEARHRISRAELSRQMRGVWFDARMAEALREEAPTAYKDVRKVMRAQRDLTRIVRRLRPVLSYKGA